MLRRGRPRVPELGVPDQLGAGREQRLGTHAELRFVADLAEDTRSRLLGGLSASELTTLGYVPPFIGQVIGGTLSASEKNMIKMMDEKDRARYLLQKRMSEKAEMAVLLSQLQALRHQTALSQMRNIRQAARVRLEQSEPRPTRVCPVRATPPDRRGRHGADRRRERSRTTRPCRRWRVC